MACLTPGASQGQQRAATCFVLAVVVLIRQRMFGDDSENARVRTRIHGDRVLAQRYQKAAICRQKMPEQRVNGSIAMQKVEGSSPFIRSSQKPRISRGFFVLGACSGGSGRLGRTSRADQSAAIRRGRP